MYSFSELCSPAKVYVVLAAFSIIIMIVNKQLLGSLLKLIFAFIFTYFLNWLCSKGYSGLSWFIVLLPFIFIILSMLVVFYTSVKFLNKQNQTSDPTQNQMQNQMQNQNQMQT
jgi:predicted PurR-regulated permease PerM